MASANSRNQFGFVLKQDVYGTVKHTLGTSNVGNADAFRLIELATDPGQPLIDRPDKTGDLSALVGIGDRKLGTWSMRCSLVSSGAAGTKPDIDEFLEAAMGKAGTVVASTSVTYGLEDASPSLDIYNFYDPAGIVQQLMHSAIVQQMRIRFGENVNTIEFSGVGRYLDSNIFATADATEKGGLTSFPARPSAPVTNGGIKQGFTGTITLDGNTYSFFRSGTLIYDCNRQLPQDVFNSFHSDSPTQGVRNVRIEAEIYEDDGANYKSLLLKAHDKTPVNLSLALHAAAGNIWTINLKNVLFDSPARDDSSLKLSRRFSGKAHRNTGKDEFDIVLT